MYSKNTCEWIGEEQFRGTGRVKVNHADDGDIRWYLEDGSEYAIISERDLSVLHFRRTPAGWLAFDPTIGTIESLLGRF
jgi:hypothetical protein